MATFLFDKIIFGPVHSRRMGVSLGVNLLPKTIKYCNYNCIYCECGFTPESTKNIIEELPTRTEIRETLIEWFQTTHTTPDALTFAGNGEPTIHPNFAEIIDDVIDIRNTYCPNAEIVVLTNATMMHKEKIMKALHKVDRCMFKLDSAIDVSRNSINQPGTEHSLSYFINHMSKFEGKRIIQTLFIKGIHEGQEFDNTTDEEIDALISAYKHIHPHEVIVYSTQRDTPIDSIEQISQETLLQIAEKIKQSGIPVSVSS
ncbi:MAG: radical SAM protein [Bacteroidales bacterium]|jgi:wyosine [tRNA(Phe)-imidazoG37] synthetase (radical SAM superfamily)|nr:radical SAM protein [Bacteroidales bacterium]